MKRLLFALLLLISHQTLVQAQAPAMRAERSANSFYLVCTGWTPIWLSWQSAEPRGTEPSKLTMKVDKAKRTVTVLLPTLGEVTYPFEEKPEWYYGTLNVNTPVMGRNLASTNISINRLTGDANIGYTLDGPPQTSGKIGFNGTCVLGSVLF